MKITNISSTIKNNKKVISANIDDFHLWYELPEKYGSDQIADAFVAAALMVAMYKGEDIYVQNDKPVSYKLMQGIYELQAIYKSWYPGFHSIRIHALVHKLDNSEPGFAAFFSGGIDSLYTFLTRKDQISHLIFINGIDLQLDNDELYEEVSRRNLEYLNQYGQEMITISTNIRKFCHSNDLGWGGMYSGAGLGSIAILTGFRYVLIPASLPFNFLAPDSTSPVTDPLYSTEATDVYYDGGIIRFKKILFLANYADAMQLIRVCWHDNGYNCGKCEKCVRTMLIFKMFDIQCANFPALDDLSLIKKWRVGSVRQKRKFNNLMQAAEYSRNTEIIKLLRGVQRRENMKNWLVSLDKSLFLGNIKKLFYRVKGSSL